MGKLVSGFVAASVIAGMSAGAFAEGNSGEVSAMAQYVITADGRDGGTSDCSGGSGGDFCDNAAGIGGYLGYYIPTSNGWAIYSDVTLDIHHNTAQSLGSSENEYAVYSGLGIHLIDGSSDNPWGIFGVIANGKSNAEDDPAGIVLGVGAEKRFGDSYIQGGHLVLDEDDDSDTLNDLTFVKAGHGFVFGNAVLDTSLAYGQGDFDEGPNDDEGKWVQLAIKYQAPINDSLSWFVGYQGDYVKVDRGSDYDKATFHSIQLGVTMPFGAGAKSPFKTPNFRAPLVNADEMN